MMHFCVLSAVLRNEPNDVLGMGENESDIELKNERMSEKVAKTAKDKIEREKPSRKWDEKC